MEIQAAPPRTLGESFRSFYDPNDHFLLESGEYNHAGLMSYLDDKRQSSVAVATPSGLQEFSGRKLLALELAHLIFITHDDISEAELLGLPEQEIHEAIDIATFGAQQIVAGIIAAKDVMLANDEDLRALTDKRDPLHLLTAGAILAAKAHEGVRRNSGVDFIYHQIAAASIAGIAARKDHQKIDVQSVRLLRRLQYVSLGHDGFEDSIPSKGETRGQSFLSSPRIVPSPLVHFMLLKSLELNNEESYADAKAIYLLAKPVGPEDEGRMDYSPYAKRLVAAGQIQKIYLAELAKMVDIQDNSVIDPKRVTAIDEKHEDKRAQQLAIMNGLKKYDEVFELLERESQRADVPKILRRVGRSIRKVKPSDTDEFKDKWSTRILSRFRNEVLLQSWADGQAGLPPEMRLLVA